VYTGITGRQFLSQKKDGKGGDFAGKISGSVFGGGLQIKKEKET